MEKENSEQLYTLTTAPESYDYSWAKTINPEAASYRSTGRNSGLTMRLVRHDDAWHMEQQRSRYQSGGFVAIAKEKVDEWIELGIIKDLGE